MSNSVPKALVGLLPKFFQKRKEDLEVLLICIDNKDFQKIQDVGHRISGTAYSFGFNDIGDVAVKIEKEGKNKNLEGAKIQIEEYKRQCERMEYTIDE